MRVSAFVITWTVYAAALAWLVAGFWLRDRAWLWAIGIILFAVLLIIWPRCRRCDLPAFLRRRAFEPDQIPHYVEPRLTPGVECARCGFDLRKTQT
jgi:hypothetical protein